MYDVTQCNTLINEQHWMTCFLVTMNIDTAVIFILSHINQPAAQNTYIILVCDGFLKLQCSNFLAYF